MARGSVFKRSGGWAYRVDIGFHPELGTRRQMLKQGFGTRKAAEAGLAEAVRSSSNGTAVARTTVRVEEFLADWLVTARSKLRPTTLHSYAMTVDRVNRHLGKYQLQSLTPLQIERFYADQLASGGRNGQPLSNKTVRNVHVVLRKALADAERLGLTSRNAAAAARAPAARRPEFDTWSSDDLQQFFESIAGDRLRPAFVVLATTGLRRGELLGLRWRDLDLDARQLAVVQTLTTVGNEMTVTPPKTNRSRRTVFLDNHTVSVLRDHRRRQREEQLLVGEGYDDSNGLVFRNELGAPVHPDSFGRRFNQLVKRAGVPRIRLHDLRHTHATLALKAGVHPKVVSERLGHATTAITLDLYSHVTPGIARDAADLVAESIFG